MKVVLELQDQPSNIKKVTVRHDIVIGRGADCNLRLSAPQVSRRHSFLRVSTDGASLTDLDSSNGTWMNGKKLTSGKRYDIPDGAILAIGPVKFIARVRSEVAVGEQLQVHLQDDRIEAELTEPVEEAVPDPGIDATISDLMMDDDGSSMNFAIEQGGSALAEDEPTTDFVPSESADRGLLVDAEEVVTLDNDDDDEILEAQLIDDPETVALAEDVIEVGDDAVLQVDGDLIEIVDDGDGEAMELVEDDDLILVEDDDVLVMDDEIVEVVDESSELEDDSAQAGEVDEADELKNFLKGLD